MDVSNRRIVIVGKTGAGKSSLANTILGQKLFRIDHTLSSGTKNCQTETKSVNGRSITLIDTPGFFDTDSSEEEVKPEIVRCITECAPGPHAFLIVLKVEKFTEQEQAVITKIQQRFSEEVLKYATVVFTHGDQLPDGLTIEDFVSQNKFMSDLVKKCGGRWHVVDNKYWNENPNEKHRSNQFQVEKLLNTIEKITEANNGSCYTNEMLQAVEGKIQQEEEHIRQSSGNMSVKEIRERAKGRVYNELLIKLAGIGTGALLGALFGVIVTVGVGLNILMCIAQLQVVKTEAATAEAAGAAGGAAAAEGAAAVAGAGAAGAGAAAGGGAAAVGAAVAGAGAAAVGAAVAGAGAAGAGAAVGAAVAGTGGAAAVGGAAGVSGVSLSTAIGAPAAVGAVIGGVTGYCAAEAANTPQEAAKMAAEAVKDGALFVFKETKGVLETIFLKK